MTAAVSAATQWFPVPTDLLTRRGLGYLDIAGGVVLVGGLYRQFRRDRDAGRTPDDDGIWDGLVPVTSVVADTAHLSAALGYCGQAAADQVLRNLDAANVFDADDTRTASVDTWVVRHRPDVRRFLALGYSWVPHWPDIPAAWTAYLFAAGSYRDHTTGRINYGQYHPDYFRERAGLSADHRRQVETEMRGAGILDGSWSARTAVLRLDVPPPPSQPRLL